MTTFLWIIGGFLGIESASTFFQKYVIKQKIAPIDMLGAIVCLALSIWAFALILNQA